MLSHARRFGRILVSCLLLAIPSGCLSSDAIEELIDSLDDIEVQIDDQVDVIQVQDPRTVVLPPAAVQQGDTVFIDNSVTIINDVQTDIIVTELPDTTILGFENLTGYDIYVQYFADNDLQGIFVFDGETLLLDYPCLGSIELVSEDDFDPFDGVLVDSFDLGGIFFTNPEDFECGDAFIMTFDFDAITAGVSLDFVN